MVEDGRSMIAKIIDEHDYLTIIKNDRSNQRPSKQIVKNDRLTIPKRGRRKRYLNDRKMASIKNDPSTILNQDR